MAVSSKWSQHFSSVFSAMLYILLTLSLWWRNPSRCGLTTKPLPSHLQGADSPTPTAQNCTFQRVEKGERHRKKDKEREREEREKNNTELNRQNQKWTHKHLAARTTQTHTKRVSNIRVNSMLSVYNVTYLTHMVENQIFFSTGTDLLLLMLSEWSISSSTPFE